MPFLPLPIGVSFLRVKMRFGESSVHFEASIFTPRLLDPDWGLDEDCSCPVQSASGLNKQCISSRRAELSFKCPRSPLSSSAREPFRARGRAFPVLSLPRASPAGHWLTAYRSLLEGPEEAKQGRNSRFQLPKSDHDSLFSKHQMVPHPPPEKEAQSLLHKQLSTAALG